MVRIASYVPLLLSFVAFASSTPVKRTVAEVNAAIASISSQTSALDTAITNYPATGGTLAGALGIHNSAVSLVTSLNSGTTTVTNTGPVGETDGQAILASVQAFEPTIYHALTGIVAKKPAFQALPIGGIPALVLQDLRNLKTATTSFANALITNAPASTVAAATTLRDNIVAAFDIAIAAYA